ncbi:hypothetical protein EYF80_036100 [Liparis tanakae]|uniref:Uncharacterized protein n=1 Tax=Liparis tanakae TaxID=230148 RepID=A0A4Z2GLM0_9TELE|nr:hypothetical protein EYF80_036100 [Liparis tanakae]
MHRREEVEYKSIEEEVEYKSIEEEVEYKCIEEKRAMQHRCMMEAVVSSTSSEIQCWCTSSMAPNGITSTDTSRSANARDTMK